MSATATVKLNVGGKLFEVSRALIDEHPDTMLAKLVSDAWTEDPESTTFIDRDGDIFAHVLNYLRYGSIELPINLPRSMFNRELDYYGFPSNEGITNQESLAETFDSISLAKSKHDMFHLAMECYYQFGQARIKNPSVKSASVCIGKDHKLYNGRWAGDEEKKLFDDYLGRYGLEAPTTIPPSNAKKTSSSRPTLPHHHLHRRNLRPSPPDPPRN